VWGGPAFAVLVVLSLAAIPWRLPYYSIAPGGARLVNDLVKVDGTTVYPPAGRVAFTTVSLDRVNVYEALAGWLDSDVDVFPEEAILGDTPREELTRVNLQAMADSKQVATYVALSKLGYDVKIRGEGALVLGVIPGLPAEGVLQAGEAIVAVDGQPVRLDRELVDALGAHQPGDRVTLDVLGTDGASRRQVAVELGTGEGGRPMLGIQPGTRNLRFDYPFTVTIDSGDVGGPSAGLAFTLALIDLLTPGELTGGKAVACTGTILANGDVGPVGGVAQKTAAVRSKGVAVFLVPAAEYEEALRHAGDSLRVEPVEDLDDALKVLGTLQGSNALALGTPGKAPAGSTM
jgi:PDZ domain-containing protein